MHDSLDIGGKAFLAFDEGTEEEMITELIAANADELTIAEWVRQYRMKDE